jgi:hypothetical protein
MSLAQDKSQFGEWLLQKKLSVSPIEILQNFFLGERVVETVVHTKKVKDTNKTVGRVAVVQPTNLGLTAFRSKALVSHMVASSYFTFHSAPPMLDAFFSIIQN